MSAETLRRAAALMRERAEVASEWNADVKPGDSLHLWVIDYDPSDPSGQTSMQRLVGGADAPWSEHIAAMHPAVALAVADWMEYEADMAEQGASVVKHALALARAYLGEGQS